MKQGSLPAHLLQDRYGNFTLTDAVRPGPGVPIRPRQGYRIEVYRDRRSKLRLPMLSAAVSRENLFDLFVALLEPLGDSVHCVLESSHDSFNHDHTDFRRTHIDTPVLLSNLYDFEDMLVNDGCTGIAVLSTHALMEVQFDEHKLLHIYAPKLAPFRRIFRSFGVRRREQLGLISEAEHLHHTTEDYGDQFQQLCTRVGVADFESVLSDEF